MAFIPLSTGLETIETHTLGWNVSVTDSIVLLDTWMPFLLPLLAATDIMGTAAIIDNATTVAYPDAITTTALADTSGGVATTTILTVSGSGDDANINNNMASLVNQLTKARANETAVHNQLIATLDYCDALKAKINSLLVELRTTTGCGILAG